MTRTTRRQSLKWGGSVLVAFGLIALIWDGASLARMYLYQEQSTSTLDHENLLRPVKTMLDSVPKAGTLLGSISIPRVRVSSVIVEGTDDHTLTLSVGHIPGTAVPGREGNVALAGHRDTFFRGLRNIRNRDEIVLTTSDGTHLYEVESTRVVSPDDVDVLNDVGRPLLTLVTCYPFYFLGSAPKRFIVQAHRLGS
jgi:sortase A